MHRLFVWQILCKQGKLWECWSLMELNKNIVGLCKQSKTAVCYSTLILLASSKFTVKKLFWLRIIKVWVFKTVVKWRISSIMMGHSMCRLRWKG